MQDAALCEPVATARHTNACAALKDDQGLCANLGLPTLTSFDTNKASTCKEIRASLSCTDYLAQLQDSTLAPAPCGERCH